MPRKAARIVQENNLFVIETPFRPTLVERIKALPGRRWDQDRKVWTVPSKYLDAIEKFAGDYQIPILQEGTASPEGISKDQAAAWRRDIEAQMGQLRQRYPQVEIPEFQGKLLPWQEDAVRFAVDRGYALIADDMGVGKTVEALSTLALRDCRRPVVVAPATAKLTWANEVMRFFPSWRISVLSGTDKRPDLQTMGPEDATTHVRIVNYDILHSWLLDLANADSLVFDESHKLKNGTSRRTKAAVALARQTSPSTILMLSGTPIVNYPAEFIPQLTILGRIKDFGGSKDFLWRYCDPYMDPRFGFRVDGAANLDELNYKLRQSCMIRRLKSEVMSAREAPQVEVVTLGLTPSERKIYETAESKFLEKLESEEFGTDQPFDWNTDVDDLVSGGFNQDNDARGELSRLRKKLADLKARAVVEWCQEFLSDTESKAMSNMDHSDETSRKLVVYAEHHTLVDVLTKSLNAIRITGRESMPQRQRAVEQFQNDPKQRVMIISSAGNENITLTASSDIAIAELPWTPKDLTQAIARVDRQGQKRRVAVYELITSDTIEQDVLKALQHKLQVATRITDNPTATGHTRSMADELMETFRQQLRSSTRRHRS